MINSTAHKHQEAIVMSLCSDTLGIQTLIEEGVSTKFEFNPQFFLSVNTILSLVAIFGNILILIALHKVSSLHPPSKLLLRCLSTTDLCVRLISQPLYIVYLATVANKNWSGVCGITEGLAHASSSVLCGESISTLAAISVDRLLALMLGLRYRQVVTLTRVRLFVITSWIVHLTFPLTYYLWDKRIFFFGSCVWIFLCLTISTCCYLKIYLILRHHQAQIGDEVQGNGLGTSGMNMGRYKKTVSSALWIHSALLVCYLPYTISTAVTTSRDNGSPSSIVWIATGILVFFNSTLNPFLYCWKMTEVSQAVKQRIRNIFCQAQ